MIQEKKKIAIKRIMIKFFLKKNKMMNNFGLKG